MSTDSIDLNSLKYLSVLVREGNVSRAAQKLGISQPSMSHVLRKLRLSFDDPLLVYSGGKMLPTPKGEWLAAEANLILQQVEGLKRSNALFDCQTYGGKFMLSVPEYVEHRLTSVLSALIRTNAPRANLQIRSPNPLVAESQLASGELDIRIGWVDHAALSIRSRHLYNESFVCLVRQDHPRIGAELTTDLFTSEAQIRVQTSQQASTASRSIDDLALRIGKAINVQLIVPSVFIVGKVVAESDLIACVPRRIGEHLAAIFALKHFPVPLKVPPVKVAMYWHEKVHNERRHVWLRNMIVAATQNFSEPTAALVE